MPENFSDIMVSLNRRDIQQEYFEKKTCYLATISTPIDKMIFDCADLRMSNQEKTRKIVQ